MAGSWLSASRATRSLSSGVDPRIVIGPGTEIIAGEGKIVTAGGVDTHIHFICPQQIEVALASGVTTLDRWRHRVGHGNLGDDLHARRMEHHANAPGISRACRSTSAFSARETAALAKPLEDMIEAGACGLKLHEDWGTTLAVIDTSLTVADKHDIQIAIHTDTLNECGFLDDTIGAIKGRAIHSFHTEGAGGGHAPDIIKIAGEPNVLPSSTNPTRPFTVNTIDEHLDMLMVCHHLSRSIPEDVAFAESRIRAETIGAEDVFHDRGIISMMSSDSQAMGRIGEAIVRTWQTAHKMKVQLGALKGDSARNDNERVKRYVAKYTINPAITHGIAEHVGSIEPGKLADLVLYEPAYFGVKPFLVLKGGLIVNAQMGDPNASIATPQPVYMRPQFAAYGRALSKSCMTFVSKASLAGRHRGALRTAARGGGRRALPRHRQERHEAQRGHARDPGRP